MANKQLLPATKTPPEENLIYVLEVRSQYRQVRTSLMLAEEAQAISIGGKG